MKKFSYLLLVVLLLTACSSDGGSDESSDAELVMEDSGGQPGLSNNQAEMNDSKMEEVESIEEESSETDNVEDVESVEDRKIIYNANFQLESESFDDMITFLENQTDSYQGYIVTSNYSNHEEEKQRLGSLTIRIPAERFQDFIAMVEDGNLKILDKSVSGEDVTEQFVDLSSRLKSKKVVEERLLSFMEDAEKTEDLLKISNDLADVQEDIEQLTGKIKYLENQSDFATIHMELVERKVDMPSVQDESLTTWEKTQEQFLKSIQTLLSIASAIFVFLVGNAPVLILLSVIGIIIYFSVKRNIPKKDS
ncbi:DUF4349 domain-containing protein [Gracilibacillus kekensis]|uniref:DUF4349 domain-containing protein n=1 Tax=Gracilibacillus kekensis TaxID=1027249 RepID=A0A1M7QKS5_9BACI|nr:DUF4349 domain-containing protein [Gracilibacillus kekensis]SHN31549.1 protein of unknown function [Gracilibacillus kekensis]